MDTNHGRDLRQLKTICKCGMRKDRRSKQCRHCRDGWRTLQSALFRLCPKCGEEKPLDAFAESRAKGAKQGRQSYCKPCNATTNYPRDPAKLESWRQANQDKQRLYTLRSRLRRLGLVSQEEAIVERVLATDTCDICGDHIDRFTHNFCIDHDHATGRFRGLLCRPCNSMLGHAHDDISKLQKAIAYLQQRDTHL